MATIIADGVVLDATTTTDRVVLNAMTIADAMDPGAHPHRPGSGRRHPAS